MNNTAYPTPFPTKCNPSQNFSKHAKINPILTYTLCMSTTKEFPKKYNPIEREDSIREFWREENVYAFDTEDTTSPVYSVDTPPPYVSADHLHAGHIMSYSQAEFVVRYKRMRGYNVFYPMGFDDNGLPTERYVEKKHKIKNKESISRSDFVKLCLEETAKGAQNYRDLWELLGISVDWSKTYSTINDHSQKISQWSFLDLYKKGLIKREEQPIMWDISFQTALAQTDLEDSEQDSHLNDIEFTAEDGTPLVISTTRPELIPACVALYHHPDDPRYAHLKDKRAIVPTTEHHVPIKTSPKVDMEFGTGLMMVCTWGDTEDIEKWREDKLDTRCIMNEKGIVNELGGKYAGTHIAKLRQIILEDLDKAGKLKAQKAITHTVQVSERSGTPVEFIQTKQWFIKLLDHKQELLDKGEELNWYPPRMYQIYKDWVTSLKWDWCISRQRYYGVPVPVWYHKETGEIILPDESELPVDPTEYTPKGYDPKDLIADTDVMDTWMTSSVSPVIGAQLAEDFPLDDPTDSRLYPSSLRPQAFEIIRTWLFYTITKSLFHHGQLPFSDAMISGHGLDETGRKISKRLGNYVEPSKIIAEFGADALRYWATGASLGESLRYSPDEVKKGKKTVTKLFNAAKFVQMHVDGVNFDKKPQLEPVDIWALSKLDQTIEHVSNGFEGYEYSKAKLELDNLFWNTFTDNYLEFIKYRLYGDDEVSKYAARHTLYRLFEAIVKMYAPIMPFITEEIYQVLYRDETTTTSIHKSHWPDPDYTFGIDTAKAEKEFEEVLKVVEAVRGYKSQNGISLGKEIETYTYQGPEFLKQYKLFLEKSLRVLDLEIITAK
jgi:valyl-tRNA synthetase